MGIFSSLFASPLVGLDIGVSGIKAVELTSGKTPRLVAYNRIPLPPEAINTDGEIIDRALVVTALKKLFSFKGFSTKRVAVGASGNAIITKKIQTAKMTREDLGHQLYFEAEQYIPFNINDVNLDFAILGPSATAEGEAPKMDVLLVAAKKDYVNNLTALITEAGLVPDVIDNQAFALGNAFEFNYGHMLGSTPGGAVSVIIDFGAGSTKLSVVEGDKTTFTRELRQSGLGLTQFISQQMGLNLIDAERSKIMEPNNASVRNVMADYMSGLVDEISRTLDFYIGQAAGKSIQGIYVCGGASRTAGLGAALEAKLPAPIQALNPIQSVAGSGQKMNAQAIRELAYLGAVAIGLALRTTGENG
jgi:type IV pilus assembly protein PilM